MRESKLFRGRPWLIPLLHVPVVMAWLHVCIFLRWELAVAKVSLGWPEYMHMVIHTFMLGAGIGDCRLRARLVETGSARVLSRGGTGSPSTSARADRSTFRYAPNQLEPRVLRYGVARLEGAAEFRHFGIGINSESGRAYPAASRSST